MTRSVLVLNCGSSSIKYRLTELPEATVVATGLVERIGETTGDIVHDGPNGRWARNLPIADHEAGMALVTDAFEAAGPSLAGLDLAAVGHRVVHGGTRFVRPTLIDDEVCRVIDELRSLAPLHNGPNLAGIAVARRLFAEVPHVAVFDTAFHATLPEHAWRYAVPREWAEHGVRRYGFHGTSYSYVSREAARLLAADPAEVNLVVLHLGNGASAAAIRGGVSVETSMGLTPLEGLVMGTRSGDVDPAVVFHLHRELGLAYEDVDAALNHDSGLYGLAGDNDVRNLLERADAGEAEAIVARDVYCHRIRKYLGAYLAVLGRVDAVVFTAGVGEHAAAIRREVLTGLEPLGIRLDDERNRAGRTRISSAESPVAVLVVPTDEEHEIATAALAVADATS